jgi:hypothetical protein
MSEKLSPKEVAMAIRVRRLLKEKGLAADTDVTTLCEHAGISRKTGYQWEKRLDGDCGQDQLRQELEQIKAEHEKLKKDYDDVCWENQGRKIAWEIHEVDAMLSEKKSITTKNKKKKR